MPSITRLLGLLVLVAAPGVLAAQGFAPSASDVPGEGLTGGPAAPLPFTPPDSQVVPAAATAVVEPVRAATPAAPPAAIPLAPARGESHVPLGAGSRAGRGDRAGPAGSLPAMATVGGSLAVVLGLFFVFAWTMRHAGPRGSVVLPGEVFEVLGRAPLAGRQQVHLLRCGGKLLLVSITPAGAETLTEVTDPVEVDRLAGLCRQAHPQSATAAFRQVFQQLAPKRAGRGLLDGESVELATRRRDRWEEEDA